MAEQSHHFHYTDKENEDQCKICFTEIAEGLLHELLSLLKTLNCLQLLKFVCLTISLCPGMILPRTNCILFFEGSLVYQQDMNICTRPVCLCLCSWHSGHYS